MGVRVERIDFRKCKSMSISWESIMWLLENTHAHTHTLYMYIMCTYVHNILYYVYTIVNRVR